MVSAAVGHCGLLGLLGGRTSPLVVVDRIARHPCRRKRPTDPATSGDVHADCSRDDPCQACQTKPMACLGFKEISRADHATERDASKLFAREVEMTQGPRIVEEPDRGADRAVTEIPDRRASDLSGAIYLCRNHRAHCLRIPGGGTTCSPSPSPPPSGTASRGAADSRRPELPPGRGTRRR